MSASDLSPTALPNDQRDKSQDTEEAISPQTSQGMRDAVVAHNPLLPLQESATTEQESIGQSPPLSSTPKPRNRKEKELLDLQLPGSTPLTTRRTSAEPGQYRKPQHSQLVTSPNYRSWPRHRTLHMRRRCRKWTICKYKQPRSATGGVGIRCRDHIDVYRGHRLKPKRQRRTYLPFNNKCSGRNQNISGQTLKTRTS